MPFQPVLEIPDPKVVLCNLSAGVLTTAKFQAVFLALPLASRICSFKQSTRDIQKWITSLVVAHAMSDIKQLFSVYVVGQPYSVSLEPQNSRNYIHGYQYNKSVVY